jgi:hypothetical protein
MMRFELKLEEPKRREAYLSALIMGLAYFIGMSPLTTKP